MTTENTNANEKSFRTEKDEERVSRAAEVVALRKAAFDAKESACAAAEEAYIADPTDKALQKAKDASRERDEVARDLELAKKVAGKAEREIRAAERVAIAAEIARIEAARGGPDVDRDDAARRRALVDDTARMLAVEIGILQTELDTRIMARRDQLKTSLDELNVLRGRIGAPATKGPWSDGTRQVLQMLAKLTDAARTGKVPVLDSWEEFGDLEELRARVMARRSALEKSKSVVGIAKAAAVASLGALAGFTLGIVR